jgi:hypothetical protein
VRIQAVHREVVVRMLAAVVVARTEAAHNKTEMYSLYLVALVVHMAADLDRIP